MSDYDKPYYRIMRYGEDPVRLTIVCLQYFDKSDYNSSSFLCAKGTDTPLKFSTENKAIAFLNINIKTELIDPNYRNKDNDSFYKD